MHGLIIGERRMFCEALALVPKKNGKTTVGATMTLTEFILFGLTMGFEELCVEQALYIVEIGSFEMRLG